MGRILGLWVRFLEFAGLFLSVPLLLAIRVTNSELCRRHPTVTLVVLSATVLAPTVILAMGILGLPHIPHVRLITPG